ncbi:MAG: VWA domain-containing protein [bacterium]|nr:VWA domain-containing protein [bacterium]
MRRKTAIKTLIQAVLLVGFTGQAALTAAPASVRLDVQMSTPKVLTGARQKAYMRIALTGLDLGQGRRAPANVAIVLDRSGSMSGRKIEEAKRAAIMAMGQLQDDDIVSVVTYESTVDVLVPATKLRDREAIRQAIRRIRADGKTALFAGVSKGARELRKFLDRNRVNTLLLLSDGLANVGPSSPGDLAQLGTSLARQGIAVTTIGLGLQYNEDLMTRLAMASDGNHFFVEDESDLEMAFATEFGDVVATVAQGVTIHIECPSGVIPIRALGREAQITGRTVHASLNQLYRDQTRYLLLEVEVPSASAGKVQRVADVTVGYHDLRTGSQATLRGGASVRFTESAASVERARSRDVTVSVVSQVGAERNQVATALRDAGKVEEARDMFRFNAAYLEKNAQKFDDSRLQLDAVANNEASKNLDDDEWKRERKKQRELQYKTQNQRVWTKDQKKD